MSQDTNVENLIINKLTKAQYESITNPDPTQLYFITDEGESISTLDDVSLNNIANGQILKYNATTQKWENSAVGGGTWGSITGTLSNQTDLQTALDAKQNTISDLSTIRSGASLGATALQPNDNITELVNNAGYITSSALTPYVLSSSLATVATTGDYDDLTNKPTIPTVNNGTLTIQKNGTTVSTFTANDTNNVTANISVPTAISDLTDDTSTYPIDKAESVVDNNSGNLKFWTGTKAQYDAITTKDSNTLYNITDDSNPTLSMLELLYPVGSIYIGTMSACPLQTLGVGTWQLVATDRVLQGAGTRGSVGDTLNESLPNIKSTGTIGSGGRYYYGGDSNSALYASNAVNTAPIDGNYGAYANLNFDASRYSSTYQNNAPVQQDAYLVNIWERIS